MLNDMPITWEKKVYFTKPHFFSIYNMREWMPVFPEKTFGSNLSSESLK